MMDKGVWICILCFFIQKAVSRNTQGHPNYLRGSYFNDINPIPSLPRESVHPLQPHVNLQLHPVQHLSHFPEHLSNSLQPLPHPPQSAPHVGHSPSETTPQITPFVHHLLPSKPALPPKLAQTVSSGSTSVQTLSPIFGLMSPTLQPPQDPLHANLFQNLESHLIPNLQSQADFIPNLRPINDFSPNLQPQRDLIPNIQLQRGLIQNLQPQNDLFSNIQLQGNLVPILQPQSHLIPQPIFRKPILPQTFNLDNQNAIVTLSPFTRVGAIPQPVLPSTPPYDVPETTPSYQVPAPAPTFFPENPTPFPITPKPSPRVSLDIDQIPFHPTTVFQAVPNPTPQLPHNPTPQLLHNTETAPQTGLTINNFNPAFEKNPIHQSPHLEIIPSFQNINPFPPAPHPNIEPSLGNIHPLLPAPHPTIEPTLYNIQPLPRLDSINPLLPNPHPTIQSSLPRKPPFPIRESRLLTETQNTPSNQLLPSSCSKKEECVNEYSPICEQTFLEKDSKECSITQKQSCKPRTEITYELACFHPLEEVCRRREDCGDGECDVSCHRVQGKRSCKKIGVKTPVLECVELPEEVCVNVKKKVPYEKCHDVAKKVCHQVDICV